MTFEYEEKEIDVILIDPKGYVPYYLEKSETDKKSEKNKTINAGSIYTRVEDKNTPINTTASLLDTEKLWKMHFGLYPTPIKSESSTLNWTTPMRECIVKLRKEVGDLFMARTRRSFTPEFKIQGG